jgi:hypothetical protein
MSTADSSGNAPRERSPLSGVRLSESSAGLPRDPLDSDADARLERLLTAFFEREIPAPLRALGRSSEPVRSKPVRSNPPAPARHQTVVATLPSETPRVPSRRAGLGVITAAAAVVGAGLLLVSMPRSDFEIARTERASRAGADSAGSSSVAASSADRSSGSREATRPQSSKPEAPVVIPAREGSIEYSVTERDEPVETRFLETEHGPVEQRSRRRITNVSVIDPETGNKVEVEFPEVQVEIFPIEK